MKFDAQAKARDIAQKHCRSRFTDEASLERWILSALEEQAGRLKQELITIYDKRLEELLEKERRDGK